jgi:hypothetical protein
MFSVEINNRPSYHKQAAIVCKSKDCMCLRTGSIFCTVTPLLPVKKILN